MDSDNQALTRANEVHLSPINNQGAFVGFRSTDELLSMELRNYLRELSDLPYAILSYLFFIQKDPI